MLSYQRGGHTGFCLLQQSAEKGHKGSKEKLQLSLDTVHYLGHRSTQRIQLAPKRIKLIQEFPRPTIKWQLCGFLGLTGYWFLIFLNWLLHSINLLKSQSLDPFLGKINMSRSNMRPKQGLQEPPALQLSNCSKLFTLFVHERDDQAPGMLTPKHDFYLLTPHTVQSLLNSELTQHFSPSRLTSHEILLLSPPNLHLKHHNILNSATIPAWQRWALWLWDNDIPFRNTVSWFTRHSSD